MAKLRDLNEEEYWKIVKENMKKATIQINHKDLKRYGDSIYKSECPSCNEGLLLVGRNPDTFELSRFDRCVLCGQAFEYLDIETLQ